MGRTPFMVRWPSKIRPGSESQALFAQTDLAPAILDIANCDTPADMYLDGQSFKPLLLGETSELHRDSVLLEVVNSRAIVSGPWKYIANRWPDYWPAIADIRKTGWFGATTYDNRCIRDSVPYQADKLWPSYSRADQLYNIETDPCESVQSNPLGYSRGSGMEYYQRIRHEYRSSRGSFTRLFQTLLSVANEIGLEVALEYLERCVIEKRLDLRSKRF